MVSDRSSPCSPQVDVDAPGSPFNHVEGGVLHFPATQQRLLAELLDPPCPPSALPRRKVGFAKH